MAWRPFSHFFKCSTVLLQIERQKPLGAHETQGRRCHANGSKDKTLNTHCGQITVVVLQMRREWTREKILHEVFAMQPLHRAGLETHFIADVCPGCSHPQNGRHLGTALRYCPQQLLGQGGYLAALCDTGGGQSAFHGLPLYVGVYCGCRGPCLNTKPTGVPSCKAWGRVAFAGCS